jgi:hypothetical protein
LILRLTIWLAVFCFVPTLWSQIDSVVVKHDTLYLHEPALVVKKQIVLEHDTLSSLKKISNKFKKQQWYAKLNIQQEKGFGNVANELIDCNLASARYFDFLLGRMYKSYYLQVGYGTQTVNFVEKHYEKKYEYFDSIIYFNVIYDTIYVDGKPRYQTFIDKETIKDSVLVSKLINEQNFQASYHRLPISIGREFELGKYKINTELEAVLWLLLGSFSEGFKTENYKKIKVGTMGVGLGFGRQLNKRFLLSIQLRGNTQVFQYGREPQRYIGVGFGLKYNFFQERICN